ncbi:MAG: HDOD domain-containing protein, partial [Planctomycetota bacterium]
EALVAGLIHDVGIILEEQYLPRDFAGLPAECRASGKGLHQVETVKLGFSHAELGAAMLKRWRLSNDVVGAVRHHHDPFNDQNNLLTIFTAMSEILTATNEVGFCDLTTASKKEFGRLQSRLGLMGKKIVTARRRFEDQIADALEIFSLEEGGDAGKKAVAPAAKSDSAAITSKCTPARKSGAKPASQAAEKKKRSVAPAASTDSAAITSKRSPGSSGGKPASQASEAAAAKKRSGRHPKLHPHKSRRK